MRRNRTTLSIALKALLPLSGPLAYEGGEVLKGREVARAEQNEMGSLLGKQIEFVKGAGVDAKAAGSEAERLINVEGVKIIIGTFWSVGAPLPFKGQTESPMWVFTMVG